jgi:hypothetical protein
MAFESEMKAILLKAAGVPREVDPQAVSDYFSFLYNSKPKVGL